MANKIFHQLLKYYNFCRSFFSFLTGFDLALHTFIIKSIYKILGLLSVRIRSSNHVSSTLFWGLLIYLIFGLLPFIRIFLALINSHFQRGFWEGFSSSFIISTLLAYLISLIVGNYDILIEILNTLINGIIELIPKIAYCELESHKSKIKIITMEENFEAFRNTKGEKEFLANIENPDLKVNPTTDGSSVRRVFYVSFLLIGLLWWTATNKYL